MSWLNRIERALTPFAIPHITLYIVMGQTASYLSLMLGLIDPNRLILVPALVMQGEVWRLFTFVFYPPNAHWVLIAFVLYFLYFLGNTLEGHWGTVRYNLFLLVGYILTVGFAFLTPYAMASNVFIGGSIFLAFAYLHPDFVIYIFFILPVKMKWLALIAWVGYGYSLITGGTATRLAVLAAVGNFLLFFARDIWLDIKTGRRRMATQARKVAEDRDDTPRHRCHVCGKDSNQYPQLDFRYCSKCAGDECYCPEHIQNHEHVLEADEKKAR